MIAFTNNLPKGSESESASDYNIMRKRVVNTTCILVLIYLIIDMIYFMQSAEPTEYIIYALFASLTFILLGFANTGKTAIAALLYCTVFPFFVMGLNIAYGPSNSNVELMHLLFICIGFVMYPKPKPSTSIVLWNFICYSIGYLFLTFNSPIYDSFQPTVVDDYITSIILMTISIWLISILVNSNFTFIKKVARMTSIVEQSNTNISKSIDELQAANADLQNFVYVASHDLKVPLNSILGFQELSVDMAETLPDKTVSQLIAKANSDAKEMLKILQDLLKYARVSKENSTELFEVIDVNEIIEQIKLEVKEYFEEAEVNIIGNLNHINGIKSQIKMALSNLIINGLKLNESHNPTVSISSVNDEKSTIISIADNGTGINPLLKEHKINESSLKQDENSLRLIISKRIIEKHGGTIQLDSKHGQGNVFSVTLYS